MSILVLRLRFSGQNGLIHEIEATGRNKVDNKVDRQALGFVSYDDSTGAYHHWEGEIHS